MAEDEAPKEEEKKVTPTLAQFRKIQNKKGSGRFVVSEGRTCCWNGYNPYGATPSYDIDDDRFEIVIKDGKITEIKDA